MPPFPDRPSAPSLPEPPHGVKRVEHYALSILNSMIAGGSTGLGDEDIDYAINLAELLAKKLVERGHVHPQE